MEAAHPHICQRKFRSGSQWLQHDILIEAFWRSILFLASRRQQLCDPGLVQM